MLTNDLNKGLRIVKIFYYMIHTHGVTLQMNFLWKITFDTLYTNEFLIRIRSRALSIPSERNTIWWGHWASNNQTRAHVETSGGKQDELASGLGRKSEKDYALDPS